MVYLQENCKSLQNSRKKIPPRVAMNPEITHPRQKIRINDILHDGTLSPPLGHLYRTFHTPSNAGPDNIRAFARPQDILSA